MPSPSLLRQRHFLLCSFQMNTRHAPRHHRTVYCPGGPSNDVHLCRHVKCHRVHFFNYRMAPAYTLTTKERRVSESFARSQPISFVFQNNPYFPVSIRVNFHSPPYLSRPVFIRRLFVSSTTTSRCRERAEKETKCPAQFPPAKNSTTPCSTTVVTFTIGTVRAFVTISQNACSSPPSLRREQERCTFSYLYRIYSEEVKEKRRFFHERRVIVALEVCGVRVVVRRS